MSRQCVRTYTTSITLTSGYTAVPQPKYSPWGGMCSSPWMGMLSSAVGAGVLVVWEQHVWVCGGGAAAGLQPGNGLKMAKIVLVAAHPWLEALFFSQLEVLLVAENGNAEFLAWLLFVLLGWTRAWIQDGLMLGHIAGCSLLWFLHKSSSAHHCTWAQLSAEEVRGTWVPKGPFTREIHLTQQEDCLACCWENREPCAGINPCNLIWPFISLFCKM